MKTTRECDEIARQILLRLVDDMGLDVIEVALVVGAAASIFHAYTSKHNKEVARIWLDAIPAGD